MIRLRNVCNIMIVLTQIQSSLTWTALINKIRRLRAALTLCPRAQFLLSKAQFPADVLTVGVVDVRRRRLEHDTTSSSDLDRPRIPQLPKTRPTLSGYTSPQ